MVKRPMIPLASAAALAADTPLAGTTSRHYSLSHPSHAPRRARETAPVPSGPIDPAVPLAYAACH